jgi:prepilin-type processing-associated H-X9-DG protein
VNPFMHLSSGSDEYSASPSTPGFTYGNAPYYTLQPRSALENQTNLLDNPGISELNAVGRHHPGGDDYTGGTANFLYGDGHVEKKSLLQTVKNWEWGLKYYAISGENKVGPPF